MLRGLRAYHVVHGGLEVLRGAMLGLGDTAGDTIAQRKRSGSIEATAAPRTDASVSFSTVPSCAPAYLKSLAESILGEFGSMISQPKEGRNSIVLWLLSRRNRMKVLASSHALLFICFSRVSSIQFAFSSLGHSLLRNRLSSYIPQNHRSLLVNWKFSAV
jgi:hypothetical protein